MTWPYLTWDRHFHKSCAKMVDKVFFLILEKSEGARLNPPPPRRVRVKIRTHSVVHRCRYVCTIGCGTFQLFLKFIPGISKSHYYERSAKRGASLLLYTGEKSVWAAGRGHALWTLISLERDDQFTNGHLNTMSPSNQSCIWPVPIPTGACQARAGERVSKTPSPSVTPQRLARLRSNLVCD